MNHLSTRFIDLADPHAQAYEPIYMQRDRAQKAAQQQRSPEELKAWLTTSERKCNWLRHGCRAKTNPAHASLLHALLSDSDSGVRRAAVEVVAKTANPMPHLRRAVLDADPGVAQHVRDVSGHLKHAEQAELATLLSNHPNADCQGEAVDWVYEALGWPKAESLLYSWAKSNQVREQYFYHQLADIPMHAGLASVGYLMRLLSIPNPMLNAEARAALAYVTLSKPREEATGKQWDRAFAAVAQTTGDGLAKVAFYFGYSAREGDERLLPLWRRTFLGKPPGPWQRDAIAALMRIKTPIARMMAAECVLDGGSEFCDPFTLRDLSHIYPERFAKSTCPNAYLAYFVESEKHSESALDIAPYCNHPDPYIAAEARRLLRGLPLLPMSNQVAKVYLESTDPYILRQALNYLFSGPEANQRCMSYLKAYAAARPQLLIELAFCFPDAHADSLVACFSNLDIADAIGNTPLHFFAQNGKFVPAQKLIAAGANVNVRNNNQQTPLDIAVAYQRWPYIFMMSPIFAGKSEWIGQLNRDGINQMSRDEWLAILRPMLHKPESILPFFKAMMRQEVFVLRDGGGSSSTWDVLVNKLVMGGPGEPSLLAANSLTTQLAERMAAPAQALQMPLGELVQAWKADNFVATGTLGRSIIFTHPNTRERRVLQVQKAGEPLQTLHEEANTLQLLHEQRAHAKNPAGIPLTSRLPQPLGVLVHPGGTADVAKYLPAGDHAAFASLVGETFNRVGIYAYSCDADYLTYATDVALGAKHMWSNSLRDLFTLLDQGIAFPELANMFHSSEIKYRSDGGRYRALNSIFHNHSGGGRLHAWRTAVEFPNLRGPRAELADFAGLSTIAQAAQRGSEMRERFLDALDVSESTAAGALRANFQAEALLTWELLLGRRAVDFNAWDGMAEELKDMYGYAVALCAEGRGLPPEKVQRVTDVMRDCINWERYAAQMQMFMTPQHAAYIRQGGPFPENLFDIQPIIGRNRADSFHPERGYVGTDGASPSLAPVNGPNPIKAGEQARAMVAILDQLMAQTSRVAPLGTKVSRVTSYVAAMLIGHVGFVESRAQKRRHQA